MQNYKKEFKLKIVLLHLEEKRSTTSLSKEFGVTATTISKWVKTYCEEHPLVQENKSDVNDTLDTQTLQKQIDELKEFQSDNNCTLEIQDPQKQIDELKEINSQLLKTMFLMANRSNQS